MAAEILVAGACEVKIASPSVNSGILQVLGFNRNYAEVRKEAFFLDVPGDENGGDDGPPIEIIHLGEICIIRLELTKYDLTVANVVRSRVDGAIAGQPTAAGTLMFNGGGGGGSTMRLLLNTPVDPRNFPRVIPRNAIEIGRGTKYSTLVCEFEAHKDASGVLYNDVTG